MDIENMQPFCVPLGLCHESPSPNATTRNNFNSVHNNDNSNNICDDIETTPISKNRSKTSSPSEELLKHLNRAASSLDLSEINGNRSLFNDDSIIIESSIPSPLHLNGDDAFHYSLEFDVDLGPISDEENDDIFKSTSSPLIDFDFDDPNKLREDETDYDDIYIGKKSRTFNRYNNQVFHDQHIVDPIDIKSSPTLAQLNLNSTDDPTDRLCSCNKTLCSTNNSLSNETCNHLNNHHNHHTHFRNNSNNQHHHGFNLFTQTNSSLCHHVHHPLNHSNNSNIDNGHLNRTNSYSSLSASSAQSTCLAIAPYRKQFASPDTHQNYFSSQVNNTQFSSGASNSAFAVGQSRMGSSLELPSNNRLNQHESQQELPSSPHLQAANFNLPTHEMVAIRVNPNDCHQHNKRSTSPALVTSSSSPLSSTANTINNNVTSNNYNISNETRTIDNKLKENIEYLTALLCNGNNKLDKKPIQSLQSPSISSTMVRSYATLAHSLSTGPKLIERHTPAMNNNNNNNNNDPYCNQFQYQKHVQMNPNSEASPFIGCPRNTHEANGQLKRSYPEQDSNEWYKPTVESSVSAADSTDNNQITNMVTIDQQGSQVNNMEQLQRVNSGELKVLSSLLRTNNPTSQPNHPHPLNTTQQSMFSRDMWQDRPDCNQFVRTVNSDISLSNDQHSRCLTTSIPQINQQDNISIPANGRPITLTPLNNNSTIIQQAVSKQNRPSVFAQPASPSTSSNASTLGSNEFSTTSSTSPPSSSSGGSIKSAMIVGSPASKRQKLGHSTDNFNAKQKVINRQPRQNSISTDCSLSSYDDGFSSQVDNDDCASTKGSDEEDDDEEDDVDSDDESFYGDYTNSDLIGASISDNPENKWTLNMGRTRRNGQKRFFWQYNVQSKGPKGTRISSTDNPEDPFVLPEASDPVFSNDCQVEGVKHSGKARRGDGNDLTPNPKKLLMIGLELKKLGKIINELVPVIDLPLSARNKTRKEKNKLASRACRLKKKAQHEANKIKLYGLQREHKQVVMAIYDVRKILNESLLKMNDHENSMGSQKDDSNPNGLGETKVSLKVMEIADRCSITVAGQTSDYVNSVLEKVVSGCIDGGLQT